MACKLTSLIVAAILIQLPVICYAISCYLCMGNATTGLNCTGTVKKGAKWCFAQLYGNNTNGKFTLESATTGSGDGPPYRNAKVPGDGCFYLSSPVGAPYSAFCQCKSSDFCLSTLKLSSLDVKFTKVECISYGNTTCKGDFCMVLNTWGSLGILQTCMLGKANFLTEAEPLLELPFCFAMWIPVIVPSSPVYGYCKTNLCNSASLCSSYKPLKKMVKCHNNQSEQDGTVSGNYCLYQSVQDKPNGTFLAVFQTAANTSSEVSTGTFTGYSYVPFSNETWVYGKVVICDEDYCNSGHSSGGYSMRSLEHVIIRGHSSGGYSMRSQEHVIIRGHSSGGYSMTSQDNVIIRGHSSGGYSMRRQKHIIIRGPSSGVIPREAKKILSSVVIPAVVIP